MKTMLSAFALTALLGTTAMAQELSGEITLGSYTGVFQDEYTKAVIAPFEAAHPGVKVNYYSDRGSAGLLGALRAQAGDPQMDVVIFDASAGLIANKEGLFAPLSADIVPNMADLVPQATVQERFGPAVTFDNEIISYNTETVEGTPTSLAELWDPKYAGRLAVSAMPNIQGTGLMVMTSAMLGEDYTKSVDRAIEKLAELAPAVQTFDPKPDGYTLVLNGTVDFATGWNARAQYYAVQSDGKLGVMTPKEGTILQINTINLVEGSQNPDLAKAFIDYALSPEAQAQFTETMYYSPTNAKAAPSAEAQARTVFGQLDATLPLDWAWVATQNDRWNAMWKRRIISAGN
ncbi:ABC transporter substrate-binding protein [Falsirhodobacter sp. 20TX0035]|uniref:ABC transporter substrate-binding protein n=1 Tax=Falsirhodobacter sp. 20TX0035 TaxID=3022019 RepID=UPI00232B93BE|nr:ABC transporter substrate-binding protein [Falsirhodobacter sp. 20TX0035]MDB6454104.1 ABC transporter substrate-binding protein [Falsirhodobacter sp. 20TX0035]